MLKENTATKRQRIGDACGWRCVYCGSEVSFEHNWDWSRRPHVSAPATARATIDHVVARTHGGGDAGNEVLACFRCNASKGKRSLAEWLESESCPVPRWRSFASLFDVIDVAG